MGKGNELIHLLKTGNSGEARKLVAKIKKSGKRKFAIALNEQDADGCTALHYCAATNFLDFIEEFCEAGVFIDAGDSKGATPLHKAAANGRSEAVSILLSRGADPNISARSGNTPLHLASSNGHTDVVEYLIREHAKCTMLNVSGQTALDLACQNGHSAIVSLLLRSGQFSQAYLQRTDIPLTAMKLAAKHGHTEVLSLLIKHGFDVNKLLPGAHGTCLHESALYGKIDTVRYLLQWGADPAIKNTQGLTALDIVNHYTDPQSAPHLKQILQDSMANQARVRIAQQHQQQPVGGSYSTQLQYGQPATSTMASTSHYSQPTHTYQQQPQQQAFSQQKHPTTGYYQQPHQHHQQQQPTSPHYAQPQPHPQSTYPQQTAFPLQQPPAQQHQQQQQPLPQQPGAAYNQQPLATAQPQRLPGMPLKMNFSDMIAQKAASRRPMATSPTRKNPGEEQGVLFRSSTISASDRPSLERQNRRRSSLTEESLTPEVPYHSTHAPTLPRRSHAGPPDFKPVPPPAETPVIHQYTSPSHEPAIPAAMPSTLDVKLRKVERPKPAPAPAAEDTMANELMKKLRKRQQTIEVAEQESGSPERTATEETPPPPSQPAPPPPSTAPPEAPVATDPQTDRSPLPPVAIKPKPKPKAKPPKPAAETAEPAPPTWQAELAKRRQEEERRQQERRQQEEKQRQLEEEQRRAEEKLREEERLREEQRRQEEEEARRKEEERLREEQRRLEAEARRQEEEARRREETQRREEARRIEEERLLEQRRKMEEAIQREEEERRREEEEAEARRRQEEAAEAEAERQRQEAAAARQREEAEWRLREEQMKAEEERQRELEQQRRQLEEERRRQAMSLQQEAPGPAVDSHASRETSPSHVLKKMDEEYHAHSSSSEGLPRSNSIGSISSTVTMPTHHSGFECIPISDWLNSYKMPQYVQLLVDSGYDNTDFLLGVTIEELAELGINKVGHRKRIVSALSRLLPKEHFLTFKPASVAEWLQQLGLSQYETLMIESGYDAIDFITSVAEEELVEIGITKQGHLKRFKKGIEELSEMLLSEPPTPSPFTQSFAHNLQSSPSHSISNISSCSQNLEAGGSSTRNSTAIGDTEPSEPPNSDGSPVKSDPAKTATDVAGEGGGGGGGSAAGLVDRQVRAGSSGPPVAAKPRRPSRQDAMTEEPRLSMATSQDSGIESSGSVPPRTSEKPRPKGPPPVPKRSLSTQLTSNSIVVGNATTSAKKEESPLLTSHYAGTDHPDGGGPSEPPAAAAPTAPPTVSSSPPTVSSAPPVKQKPANRQTSQTKAAINSEKERPLRSSSSSTSNSTTEERTLDVEEYTNSDIQSALDEIQGKGSVEEMGELADLNRVLESFPRAPPPASEPAGRPSTPPTPTTGQMDEVGEKAEQTDQLLADIDNMLADLNTHLDFMIPESGPKSSAV